MWRLLSWIGKILATAYSGPGIVVLGDPGLDYEAGYPNAPRWASRLGAFAPLVVVLLFFIGLPWPFVAVVGAILLLPMILNQIRGMRRR